MRGFIVLGADLPTCDECFWGIGHKLHCPCSYEDVSRHARPDGCPLIPVPDDVMDAEDLRDLLRSMARAAADVLNGIAASLRSEEAGR